MAAVSRIDWSTVLLVGAITFVGVLQTMVPKAGEGSVGRWHLCWRARARAIELVSAFASPPASSLQRLLWPCPGGVRERCRWALISVASVPRSWTCHPYSTTGATVLATAHKRIVRACDPC
jgi:hypothetical protein